MESDGKINRREALAPAAGALAFSLVPRHVLGGSGYVAPSDKLTVALIGCGTQALGEIQRELAVPDLQYVAVCDPVKDGDFYVSWTKNWLVDSMSKTLGKPGWRKNSKGTPGGREVAKEVIDTYYGNQRAAENFKGVNAYIDFRELLEKETGVDAVKVMTPDHLHATVAIAAMRKGKHVVMHKPIANRLYEARLVAETARKTGRRTHLLAANDGTQMRNVKSMIDEGRIGTLREIHNWSNRPVWPQYPTLPTERVPVPPDFDWQLWLGPSLDRPYHPNYSFTNFRGWYEFGGGAVADMGHYSLWSVFREFDLDAPLSVESTPSSLCSIIDYVSAPIKNDYSFPAACTIRWKFAAKGARPALDVFWYDGSIRPPRPEELEEDDRDYPREGMMFVGDKGKILAGFRAQDPELLPASKMRAYRKEKGLPEPKATQRAGGRDAADWVKPFKANAPTYGDFALTEAISDAMNLAAISLRTGGQRLRWDAARMRITNSEQANKYMYREYRRGWEL